MTLDLTVARRNMIEQQIRPWEVLDQRVLDLLDRIPRDAFVPPALRNLAYADLNLPIGHGQVMMAPKVEARLLQELEIQPHERILEVGTGSGYLTALLAGLGREVVSVEIFEELAASARARLAARGIEHAEVVVGDAAREWSDGAPYDVIVLTGSVPAIPPGHRARLAPGGRLFAVVGDSPVMEAVVLTRLDEVDWAEQSVFETDLPRLINVAEPRRFVF